MATVAETIRGITRQHLVENNGLLFGQCLSAVGWVGGTVPSDIPDNKGIEELPTSDSSNGGIVVGAALVGRRPIYICRYQGFMWYNAASLVNYAAKSKEMWGIPCPIFIRALGMEGGIGPVAGGMHHSMIARMPGIRVVAPMTPKEYQQVWDEFMLYSDPVYCSEHRLSFGIDYETPNIIADKTQDVTIFAIGAARLNAINAVKLLQEEGITANLSHLVRLSPLYIPLCGMASIKANKKAVVVDSDYSICGMAEHVAYVLSFLGAKTRTVGLEHKTAGFSPATDNKTPSVERIVEVVKELL